MASGTVVPTRAWMPPSARELLADPAVRELYEARGGQMILEHERVDFPSFPYEWNPEMLHAAGMLTLDLAQALLADGLGLKDGTPYNVLFRGPEPVFIDVLSFERREPGDATWLPYAQFVRTFLLPLLANQTYGLRPGSDSDHAARRARTRRSLPLEQALAAPAPAVLQPGLHADMAGRQAQAGRSSIYQKKLLSDPEKARFILDHMLNGLRRTLQPPQAGGRQEQRVVGLHDHEQQLHRRPFPGQAAFRGRGAARNSRRAPCWMWAAIPAISARSPRAAAPKWWRLDYDPVVLGDVWRNAREREAGDSAAGGERDAAESRDRAGATRSARAFWTARAASSTPC